MAAVGGHMERKKERGKKEQMKPSLSQRHWNMSWNSKWKLRLERNSCCFLIWPQSQIMADVTPIVPPCKTSCHNHKSRGLGQALRTVAAEVLEPHSAMQETATFCVRGTSKGGSKARTNIKAEEFRGNAGLLSHGSGIQSSLQRLPSESPTQ